MTSEQINTLIGFGLSIACTLTTLIVVFLKTKTSALQKKLDTNKETETIKDTSQEVIADPAKEYIIIEGKVYKASDLTYASSSDLTNLLINQTILKKE